MTGFRILVLAAAAWTVYAQSANDLFEKAPPHIDAALRERIRIFYQAHVDGKFRAADAVVHEDSKDIFFGSKKEQFRGFEIILVSYTNNFTKATAVVAVNTDFLMPGFGKQEVKIPLTTLWKSENGQWWWYLRSPDEGVETPFGMMKPGQDSREDIMNRLGAMPDSTAIRRQVSISKTEVLLRGYEASKDEIYIANGMPGDINIELTYPPMPGLEVKLDRARLSDGQRAKIEFNYQPPDRLTKPSIQASVRITPTQHLIPIRISFTPAPEIQEKVKKP
jgi:hypothetical protein